MLVSQGVIQNFHGFTTAHTVQDATEQLIPGGPVASQIAIKQLGTNGGGFFNVNSAHPFENSTPFNNFVETWAILVLPFAFAFTFGRMVKDKRQGYAVFAIMFVVWLAMSVMAMVFEGNGNPQITASGGNQAVTATQGGGNMEGKEVRFGIGGVWPLGRIDHWHVQRFGQLDARQLHAARRRGADEPHDARRGQPRRRGRGSERSARDGDLVGVHRGPHGRPNT